MGKKKKQEQAFVFIQGSDSTMILLWGDFNTLRAGLVSYLPIYLLSLVNEVLAYLRACMRTQAESNIKSTTFVVAVVVAGALLHLFSLSLFSFCASSSSSPSSSSSSS